MPDHKILICDDEEGIRESLKLVLSEHYDLIAVGSAEQCVECVENNNNISLVLLDIKMPKVNGLEALSVIKEQKPSLPVIIVTGYNSVDAATAAIQQGASDYIMKPFKSDELLGKIQKVLKKQHHAQ